MAPDHEQHKQRGVPLFIFMASLIVLTVLASGGLYYYLSLKRAEKIYQDQVDKWIETLAVAAEVRVASAVVIGDLEKTRSIINEAFGYNGYVQHAWIVDIETGEVFFDLTGLHEGELFSDSFKTVLAAEGNLDQSVDAGFMGREMNILAGNFNNLVRQRKRAEDSLKMSEQQLRQLARRIIRTQEEERTRLAHDIHDEIGHRMTATSYIVESMKKRLGPDDGDISAIKNHLDGLAEELMRIYKGLSPMVIEKLGLSAAIRSYLNEAGEQMDISISAELEEVQFRDLPHVDAVNIYRVFQEAMTNVYRHSCAENVEIELRKSAESIQLTIEDDGKGMAVREDSTHSLGIAGMRERTLAMSGEFLLESEPGEGTRISISIPLNGQRKGGRE